MVTREGGVISVSRGRGRLRRQRGAAGAGREVVEAGASFLL
ncbi:unnamed protein product [Urochloa humidicola]